jgi:hypothetical protein
MKSEEAVQELPQHNGMGEFQELKVSGGIP